MYFSQVEHLAIVILCPSIHYKTEPTELLADRMTLYLCLPLLVVILQPALCLYNCSSEYQRTPGWLTTISTKSDQFNMNTLEISESHLVCLFFLRQLGPVSWLWHQYNHTRGQPVHCSVGRFQLHRPGTEWEPQQHRLPRLHRHQCGPSSHPLPASC